MTGKAREQSQKLAASDKPQKPAVEYVNITQDVETLILTSMNVAYPSSNAGYPRRDGRAIPTVRVSENPDQTGLLIRNSGSEESPCDERKRTSTDRIGQ